MKNLKLLSNFLTFFFILLFTSAVFAAEVKWDIAVVFLGKNDRHDEVEFQKDIDRNVLELARIKDTQSLHLSLYREMPEETYTYSPNGSQTIKLNSLLGATETGNITIKGDYKSVTRHQLPAFLRKAFTNKKAKKMLIIYGHGTGPEGLEEMPTAEMKELLTSLKIQTDILWIDSCFMANTEFLHAMKPFSKFTIASEEAEFSSGLPFETINALAQISEPRTAALFLAKSFIESYSYLLKGSQRRHVSISAATISIIDNSKWNTLLPLLKTAADTLKKLSAEEQKKLFSLLKKKYSMDEKSLVDLGQVIIELRKLNKTAATDKELTKLIRELNIGSVKKLRTNPRIKVEPPVPGALLVYGFNGWKNGDEREFSGSVFEGLLSQEQFVAGPAASLWPAYTVLNQEMLVIPFAPGIESFQYYWAHPQTKRPLSNEQSFTRVQDVVESTSVDHFLVYSAYTQSIGASAEKYTGLNITLPGSAPSIDYFEREFNKVTGWLSL